MKKLKFLFLNAVFCLNLFALSEGVEYNVLEHPILNAQNSLTEIWSYQCSHCYIHHAKKTLDKIHTANPDAKIDQMMVASWGEFGEEMAKLLAYARLLDTQNGLELYSQNSLYHKIANDYFIDIFRNRETYNHNKGEFLKMGLKILNISEHKLQKFAASSEGQMILQREKIANEIANMVGTPAFVVNGKYVINLAAAKSIDDLSDIIKELLSKDAK